MIKLGLNPQLLNFSVAVKHSELKLYTSFLSSVRKLPNLLLGHFQPSAVCLTFKKSLLVLGLNPQPLNFREAV